VADFVVKVVGTRELEGTLEGRKARDVVPKPLTPEKQRATAAIESFIPTKKMG
jgi:hypothetical protein